MVTRPRITVAMPVLNGGMRLPLAVSSIINQTYQNWELLILDDGSTDGSLETLLNVVDSRVVVIRDCKRKGIGPRLNQAIDLAHGEFFARMDHDDISHPDRLLKQLEFLETNPRVDLLATKCLKVNEQDGVTGELPFASSHARICTRPWLGFPMPHPSWMGKTSWFKKHRYQEPAPFCCEDSELLLRTHKQSIFDAIEEPMLAYRGRSYAPWSKQWRTRTALASVQVKYFTKHHDLSSATLACAATGLRLLRDIKSELVHRCDLITATRRVAIADKSGPLVPWIEELKHKTPAWK